jgi:hypothetical protein
MESEAQTPVEETEETSEEVAGEETPTDAPAESQEAVADAPAAE